MKKHPVYFGNHPNSPGYDNNVPIGYNRWDDTEINYDEDWTYYENITYVVEYPDEEKEKMKNRQ